MKYIFFLIFISCSVMAETYQPYLGLSYNLNTGYPENSTGYDTDLNLLETVQFEKYYIDLKIGYQYAYLTAPNFSFQGHSVKTETEVLYRISDTFSAGLGIKLMNNVDGSTGVLPLGYGKITYDTQIYFPMRLELGLGNTIAANNQNTLQTYLLGINFRLPETKHQELNPEPADIPKKMEVADTITPISDPVESPQIEDEPTAQTTIIRALNFIYPLNEYQVNHQDRKKLKKLAKFLADHNEEWDRIKISGHTDGTGDTPFNRALSQDRADNVLKILVESGVSERKIQSFGYGSNRQINKKSKFLRRTELEFFGVKRRVWFNREINKLLN